MAVVRPPRRWYGAGGQGLGCLRRAPISQSSDKIKKCIQYGVLLAVGIQPDLSPVSGIASKCGAFQRETIHQLCQRKSCIDESDLAIWIINRWGRKYGDYQPE